MKDIESLKNRLAEVNTNLFDIVIEFIKLSENPDNLKFSKITEKALRLSKEGLELSVNICKLDIEEGATAFKHYNISRNAIFDGISLLKASQLNNVSQKFLDILKHSHAKESDKGFN